MRLLWFALVLNMTEQVGVMLKIEASITISLWLYCLKLLVESSIQFCPSFHCVCVLGMVVAAIPYPSIGKMLAEKNGLPKL